MTYEIKELKIINFMGIKIMKFMRDLKKPRHSYMIQPLIAHQFRKFFEVFKTKEVSFLDTYKKTCLFLDKIFLDKTIFLQELSQEIEVLIFFNYKFFHR